MAIDRLFSLRPRVDQALAGSGRHPMSESRLTLREVGRTFVDEWVTLETFLIPLVLLVIGLVLGLADGSLVGLVLLAVAILVATGSRRVVPQAASRPGLRADPWTGVANRRAWDRHGAMLLAQARENGELLTVAMIRLHGLDQYIARSGEGAGQQLLRGVGRSLAASVRDGDGICHWTGEVFAVALPGCTGIDGTNLMRRLARSTPAGLRWGIGVAEWDGTEGLGELTARALDGSEAEWALAPEPTADGASHTATPAPPQDWLRYPITPIHRGAAEPQRSPAVARWPVPSPPPAVARFADPGPMALGAFGMTAIIFAALAMGWLPKSTQGGVFALGLTTGGVLLIAGVWAFLRGDTFAATSHMGFAAFWSSDYLLSEVFVPQMKGATSAEINSFLGAFLMLWGLFAVYMAIAAIPHGRLSVVLFGSTAAGFVLVGAGWWTSWAPLTRLGGLATLATGLLALYMAAAHVTNNSFRRSVIPIN